MQQGSPDLAVDLAVIGGGVNGCGIARDAAGRGLRVALIERGDLAQSTSSASTKLFHGGLRYLEYFKFRLVRESLIEREVLLRNMPHISWPMRFVLPLHPQMRFASDTPSARVLRWGMPWLRGRRPAWLIRAGLFCYDVLGGRDILPATRALDLRADPAGVPLKVQLERAYEYSDCWVDDARLVVLNARDAVARGAQLRSRCELLSARREADHWQLQLRDSDAAESSLRARAVVNAAGPWVAEVLGERLGLASDAGVRLVRGSHIVVPRLYDHERAYFLQGEDGRIIFTLPYENDFCLIGTTDLDHTSLCEPVRCSDEEVAYLCAFASRYFRTPVEPAQVVWRYSGVRPLYDDGVDSATAATRDYVLQLDRDGAPALHVFGGKITTYRRLAQAALAQLAPLLGAAGGDWTADAPLPGGDFAVAERAEWLAQLRRDHPFLAPRHAERLFAAYGREAWALLGGAQAATELGRHFGADLFECELRWMIEREFARTAEDVLWRRSKLGLRLDPQQQRELADYLETLNGAAAPPNSEARRES